MSEIGLILALGCALISGVALLCKHRGAVNAPDVALRSPLRSASALFRSRWWVIGFALAFFAWCLHVAALSMAPLSLVQAVIAGGLAMLAIPARRLFGIAVCRREMLGWCSAPRDSGSWRSQQARDMRATVSRTPRCWPSRAARSPWAAC